jgi:chemotaxis protein MotB
MAAKAGAPKKIIVVRKKKVAGGGHHGGSWKVAYADFVTAMMAFFMVMWILGMDENTKKAIEGYFANPVGYRKGAASGASPIGVGNSPSRVQQAQLRLVIRNSETRTFTELGQRIRELVDGNVELRKLGAQIEVVVAKDGLRIELIEDGSGDVIFPIGRSEMKPAAARALALIAGELAELSNALVVEGHTDAARFGTSAAYTNWELSGDRANAARRVLEANAVAAPRIVEVRGLADRHLRLPAQPLAAANRRISILLPFTNMPSPDRDSVPGMLAVPSVPAPRMATPATARDGE